MHVSAWCYPMQSGTASSRIRTKDPSLSSPPAAPRGHGMGIKAVQAGAGTEDVPNAGSLSHENGQEKPQDITQGGNGNDKTQLRVPWAPLSHKEGMGELRLPGLTGS